MARRVARQLQGVPYKWLNGSRGISRSPLDPRSADSVLENDLVISISTGITGARALVNASSLVCTNDVSISRHVTEDILRSRLQEPTSFHETVNLLSRPETWHSVSE